jgi:hypothetical protein
MLMLLMVCLLSDAGQDAVPAPSSLTVVSSVPPMTRRTAPDS